MNLVANYICRIIVILVGAWNIACAIELYENRKYYGFGVMIMMTVYMAIYLFKVSMET